MIKKIQNIIINEKKINELILYTDNLLCWLFQPGVDLYSAGIALFVANVATQSATGEFRRAATFFGRGS